MTDSWKRFLRVAFFAPGLFALCDFVFSWNPLAAAPYLAHRAEPVFRAVPALTFGTLAEGVNGLIAALAFAAWGARVPGSPWRRGLVFGLTWFGFWVVSGTMSAYVWLAVPDSLALANVACGLPKCLALGAALSWLWGREPS